MSESGRSPRSAGVSADEKPADTRNEAAVKSPGSAQHQRASATAQVHRSMKAWRDSEDKQSSPSEVEADETKEPSNSQRVSAKLKSLARKVEAHHAQDEGQVFRKEADASPVSETAGEDSIHLGKKEDDEADKQKLREKALGFGLPASFKPKFEKNKGGKWILMKKPAPAAKGNAKDREGWVDEEGRIWIRNYAHAGYPDHWDVQMDGGATYMNVKVDGSPMTEKDKNTANPPRPGHIFGA